MNKTATILTLLKANKSLQEIQDVINLFCPNENRFTIFSDNKKNIILIIATVKVT